MNHLEYLSNKIDLLKDELSHLQTIYKELTKEPPVTVEPPIVVDPPPVVQPPVVEPPPISVNPPYIDSEYGIVEIVTREPESDMIVIDKLPYLIEKPGYYILTKNLESDHSGIGIKSFNVTLDLNGCCITYGQKYVPITNGWTYRARVSGNICHNGITCPNRPDMCKDFKFGWNPIMRKLYTGVVIKNGYIKSGQGRNLSHSNAMNLTGLLEASIHDLFIEVDCPDTVTVSVAGGSHIHHCTVINRGKHITNRHAIPSSIACLTNAIIEHNLLDGCPQVGIHAGKSNSIVRHNKIIQTAVATNCYGIIDGKSNNVIEHNLVVPKNGRGIHVTGTKNTIKNNTIVVRETATSNEEYSRLQTHGIKIEYGSGNTIEDNKIESIGSKGGEPTALNMANKADQFNTIRNNVFKATKDDDSPAVAVAFVNTKDQTIVGNTFESNDWMVRPIGAAKNIVIRGATFRGLEGCQGFFFGNNYNPNGDNTFRFIDCKFENVDPKKAKWPPKYVPWDGDCEYTIEDKDENVLIRVSWDSKTGTETIWEA